MQGHWVTWSIESGLSTSRQMGQQIPLRWNRSVVHNAFVHNRNIAKPTEGLKVLLSTFKYVNARSVTVALTEFSCIHRLHLRNSKWVKGSVSQSARSSLQSFPWNPRNRQGYLTSNSGTMRLAWSRASAKPIQINWWNQSAWSQVRALSVERSMASIKLSTTTN